MRTQPSRPLRTPLLLLALFLSFSLQSQADDLSRIYYIANAASYNANSPSTNWYMVPAKDATGHYANAYFNNQYSNTSGKGDYTGTNYGDPAMPFLTTYQTNKDDNSMWRLIAVTGETGFYYIQHVLTEKYIVYEPPYQAATNRKSMHLLTTDTPSENAKFEITTSGSGYNIRPKSISSGNRFFNPAGSNAAVYCANGGDYLHNGMVGLYDNAGGNSVWYLEEAAVHPPVITLDAVNRQASIGSDQADATFYYTLDGSAPTSSSTEYTGPIDIGNRRVTVMAIAYRDVNGNTMSSGVVSHVVDFRTIQEISSLASLATNPDGKYRLSADIVAQGEGTGLVFTGTLDCDGHTISGLTSPLFDTLKEGVVKNLMLKEVAINTTGAAGAIARVAKGYSRIYNCGILPTTATFPEGTHSSVATTGTCAGSLVGRLCDDSRVVNCFSYADVSSADTVAGIVGNNMFASNTSVSDNRYANLRTMVVNCMFYGDITGGTHIWPVYGGLKITNTGSANAINNYDYYSNSCTFSSALTDYNCSWPIQTNYLQRIEFVRHLLNSNRELCGWWVGSDIAPSTMLIGQVQAIPKDASLMYKWVLDPAVAPYPILRPFAKYPSVINPDAGSSWADRSTGNPYEGKQLATLTVTVKAGAYHPTANTQTIVSLPVTDMDTIHYDFGYYKVQLPYYNTVFGNPASDNFATRYAGNYSDHVVTGWKVTAVDHEGTSEFVEDWESGYNFADRTCTDKDLYSESGRVFAQGGYYYVPDGVTAITIEAYWGNAYYLGNGNLNYDRVWLSNTSAGHPFAPAGARDASLDGHLLSTSNIKTLANTIAAGNVYDNAIVLVGNHQYRTGDNSLTTDNPEYGFTLMSVDLDFDEEPDYCLEWQLGSSTTRYLSNPIRYDFLPVTELGLALKEDGSTQYYSLGIYYSKGHFEITETAMIHFGQFEFDAKNDLRTTVAPIIINGGYIEQYSKGTTNSDNTNHINYIIVGGHALIPTFSPGAHPNSNYKHTTRHCAVNAIGGDFNQFYLTGAYNNNVTPNTDNPHCYIDGGRFDTIASAGREGINGNVTFRINRALIREFYGGGTLADKRVTGNIDVTINNSRVNKYCGGPMFGDMYEGKTVTTHATGTTFGVYYGGGNGGTSYVQYSNTDGTETIDDYDWSSKGKINSYTAGKYRDAATGYQANYETQIVNTSTGTDAGKAVFRTYFYAAQFSATNTGSVTNTLDNCQILTNFYGGGNLGGVNGNVTSTITDTRIFGSAYGAGFSAAIPEVVIYHNNKIPTSINKYTSIITPESVGDSTIYTWTHETSLGGSTLSTSSPSVMNVDGVNYFYTEQSLDNLGTVQGTVSLTIEGSSVIGTAGDAATGSVYGGGEESAVQGDTHVLLKGATHVLGSVYGGGNEGPVNGNTEVRLCDDCSF